MGFRDAQDAASHRVAALERELSEARAAVDAAPTPPVSSREAHGVTVVVSKDTLALRWSGWGAGGFFSATAMYALPGFSLMLLAAWISKGAPRVIPYDAAPYAFVAAAALALWNTAALLANRRNRIDVDVDAVSARQGVVPWPVAYRRRRVPRADLSGITVQSDWAPDTDVTVYKVHARCGTRSIPLTGALHDEDRARLIAAEVAAATGVVVDGAGQAPRSS